MSISDSFAQTCDDPVNHDDGLQVYCPADNVPQPCQNITVIHNTLSVAETGNFTAPLFGGDKPGGENGQLANSTFDGNLLWGGVFSIYLYGTNLTIQHNRIDTDPWFDATDNKTYDGPAYGPAQVTCSTVLWSDNRIVSVDNNWQLIADKGPVNCS